MIIYGINPVLESIDLYSERINRIYASKNSLKKLSKKQLILIRNIKVKYLSDYEFEKLCNSSNHQSLAAEILIDPMKGVQDLKHNVNELGNVLILDHIQDPHNLGAIARTCVFFGVNTIVIPADRAASISPGSVKSSAGAIFSVNIYQVPNLVNLIDRLKKLDYWILGGDLQGKDYKSHNFDKFVNEKIAIVVGSEGKGLGTLVKKKCDVLLKINQKGSLNSLNVGIAVGILISRFVND